MGRSKLNTSLKSNIPIPIPHDGPIFCSFKSPDLDSQETTTAFVSACQLCKEDTTTARTTTESETLEYTLIKSLRYSKSSKEQIQALQTYRSKLMNKLSKKKNAKNAEQINDNDKQVTSNDIEQGLYRLILEWSISIKTPVPLTRASQSLLNTLLQDVDDMTTTISKQVIESLFVGKSNSHWVDALFSLEVAINYAPIKMLLQNELFNECLTFLHDEYVSLCLQDTPSSSSSQSLALQSIRIVEILKILLNTTTYQEGTRIPYQNEFQSFVLLLFASPLIPVASFNSLGIVYGKLLFFSSDSNTLPTRAVEIIESLDGTHPHISTLARLQIISGIVAALDAKSLIDNDTASKQSPLDCCWRYLLRVSKTATDPVVRWGSLRGLSSLTNRWKALQTNNKRRDSYNQLIDDTLGVVLQAWENPPLRKLGASIPALFETLVQLLPQKEIERLIDKILKQPLNRKGRYLALDILLPYMEPEQLIQAGSLLEGIGDRGPNTGAIADLWTKLLIHQWNQIYEKDPDDAYGAWKPLWVPSLGRAFVLQSLGRRKQVAAFCLPRIADVMKKSKMMRPYVSIVMVDLLDEVITLQESIMGNSTMEGSESMGERVLWAQLEIARQSLLQKAFTKEVQSAIARHISKSRIQMALTHSNASIRLLAFQSLCAIVASHGEGVPGEAKLWKYGFSYAAKSTEKIEYTSTMLQSLGIFLDRLSLYQEHEGTNLFSSFCERFLLHDMIVARGAYPGTVANKEGFTLSLMGCLLTFVTQNQSYSLNNAITIKNGAILTRKRSEIEKETMRKILEAFFDREILGSLFSLLFSIWDSTRSLAFDFLSKLVMAGQVYHVALPFEFSAEEAREQFRSRGVYLASSPRQREADTGARILAFLFMSLAETKARIAFFQSLLDLLISRLNAMKYQLRIILTGDTKGIAFDEASDLPLAHGIIHALSLCIKHWNVEKEFTTKMSDLLNNTIFDPMIETLCKAIQVSLAVVADMREGENIEGLSDEMDLGERRSNTSKNYSAVPLNVNTGAIGANGTFSSVAATNEQEIRRRLAVQRVVIGAWLLTKETCAAIAAIVSVDSYRVSFSAYEKIGSLLISTLTTLKHAGAAFAARDSLQAVAKSCFAYESDDDIFGLPEVWTKRLIGEISLSEKVRDSTLRRSTGYALGFLAIMRSETSSTNGATPLCSGVLQKLLTFSLPTEDKLHLAFERLELKNSDEEFSSLFFVSKGEKRSLVQSEDYEIRCRVHALNVIRLIILDAPLTSVMQPFIGEAMISAILGYNDRSWAVRNSATMVLSAAMLRVIDADKNSSNSDSTSSNAITITELFHRYPSLSPFLLASMRNCVTFESGMASANSQIFPILLLLSRIQRIAQSGELAIALTESFLPVLLMCVGNKHHGIRAAAARALANICSNVNDVATRCRLLLIENTRRERKDWNLIDGLLLSLEALVMNFPSLANNPEGIESSLLDIVSVENSINYPPSCVATALRTLRHCDSNRPMHSKLMVSSACQRITICSIFMNTIGGSELYAVAADSFIHYTQQRIWEAESRSSFESALQQLLVVFTSDIIDVRLAAVKAFKKRIYANIDNLIGVVPNERNKIIIPRESRLSSVAKVMLQSLDFELVRNETLGAHNPTVRRLSRCFLECFYAYMVMMDSNGSSVTSFLSSSEFETLWMVAMKVAENESFLIRDGATESNGETFLSSNAAELMAIHVASLLNEKASRLHSNKMKIFVQVIDGLNDPQASWRSRHSAAMAIKTSRILCMAESYIQGFHELQGKLLFEIIGMLQDSDPDVRATAAQAASQYGQAIVSSPSSAVQLPELVLQEIFPNVYHTQNDDSISLPVDTLMEYIFDSCAGIDDIMENFEEESKKGQGENSSGSLNVTGLRKIFEDEEPNPFNEKILASQLATRSLLAIQGMLKNTTPKKKMFQMCFNCLSFLQRSINNGMAYDPTRSPSIFSPLHNLIVGVAVALYLNIDDEFDNKIMAQRILALVKEQGQSCIHPEILGALKCLAEAEAYAVHTSQAIHKSCFLLQNK